MTRKICLCSSTLGPFARILEMRPAIDEPDESDERGYLTVLTDRATRDTHSRLDEEEREAGHQPW